MPQQAEDMVAVRREMLDLLRRRMEVLNSGLELTDTQLRECFDRQGRVQELRETLQAALNADAQHGSSLVEPASVESASADLSAGHPSARAFSGSAAVPTMEPLRASLANL